MAFDNDRSVAELRSELDIKRKRALDLQTNTTNADEWQNLNTIRWDLEDLDNDLYRSQFIKNNDKLEILIGKIQRDEAEAVRVISALNDARLTVQRARRELQQVSSMFAELDGFYQETEALLDALQG